MSASPFFHIQEIPTEFYVWENAVRMRMYMEKIGIVQKVFNE